MYPGITHWLLRCLYPVGLPVVFERGKSMLINKEELITIRVRDAVVREGCQEDYIVQAIYDDRYTGVHVSRDLACRLKPELANGTAKALWVEEGSHKSHRDYLQVMEGHQGDVMVLGHDLAQHIEIGRAPLIAPNRPKETRGDCH